MKKDFGKIGVLMGGPSSEREISLRSGKAVCDALSAAGFSVIALDPKDAGSARELILKSGIDVAFIALHGRFGEDGTIQAILEDEGVPYTGSGPVASRRALDKIKAKEFFIKHNIPTPRDKKLSKKTYSAQDLGMIELPFVVKPSREGSSIGMSVVRQACEAKKAIEDAFRYDENVLVEEYICGEDITIGILDENPLPVVHIKPKEQFYNYKAKYTSGMSDYIVPADFPDGVIREAQRLAVEAHKALGCRCFSRVDMMVDKRYNKLWVLEVNTIPGLTSTSLLPKAAACAGMDFTQVCIKMVESAFRKPGAGAKAHKVAN